MMNAQRLSSCQSGISHRIAAVCLVGCLAGLFGERAAAEVVQGVFTCPLDSESSRIEIVLPGGRQQFPVQGRIGFDIQNARARIFDMALSTAPVPWIDGAAALELALDPSSPPVTRVSPFLSSFWVPASLFLADGSAAPLAHVEARLQVRFGPQLTGLVSGHLPSRSPRRRGPAFNIPVSCTPVPVQGLTSELGITSYGSYAGATVGGQTAVVNVMNGNLVVDPVDLAITGRGVSLALQRTFNGKDAGSGVFGKGWSSLLDISLRDCFFACPADTPADFLFRDATGATWSFGPFGLPLDGVRYAFARGLRARLVNYSTIVYDDGTVLKLQPFESGTYRLVSITDRNGNRLTIERDADGLPVKIVDSLGREVVLGLEAGLVTTISPPAGLATVSYGYDTKGRLTAVTRDGRTTTYFYDDFDHMVVSKDPRGFQTRFSYDSCFLGEETSIRYAREPGDTPTSFDTYTTCVKVGEATVKDPNGHTTSYWWDTTVDPAPTKIVDPVERTTRLRYDYESFRLLTVERELSQQDWDYDFYGRLVETKLTFAGQTAPLVTTFEYFDLDPRGRSCNPAASPSCLRQYLVKRVVNTEGNETGLSYDDRGNLTSVTDPLGHVTSMTFNTDGTVATMERPRGRFGFDYTYGASGNLDEIAVTDPLGRVTRKTFDAAGRLAESVAADGKATTFSRDSLDRLTAVTYADGSEVKLDHDANGNLVELTDATGTSLFKIDHRGRRIEDRSPEDAIVAYGYDRVGNLTSKTDARGTTTFGYDAGDRLVSLVQPDGQKVTYAPSTTKDREQVTADYPDGLTILRTWDGAGRARLVRATAPGVGDFAPPVDVLVDLAYSYTRVPEGGAGAVESTRLQHIDDALAGIMTDYGYDALGRLTSATTDSSRGIGHRAWTYDANGNRSRQVLGPPARQTITTYDYDDADQITSAGEPGPFPDPNPEPFPPPLPRLAYEWNDRGDLVERSNGLAIEYNDAVQTVAITPRAGAAPVVFTYRGLDQTQRLSMQQGTDAATRFTYDLTGGGPARIEPEEAGAVASSIVRTPGGELVGLQRDGGTSYFVTDRLGSVVAVVDTVVDFETRPPTRKVRVFSRYEYDPWGNVLSAAGSDGSRQPFRFAGAELDAQTGFYKMGTRYYDPAIGRFTQPDPLGGGYAYAANDPVNLTDPSGYVAEPLPCMLQTGTALDGDVGGSPFSGNDWTFKGVTTYSGGSSSSAAGAVIQVGSMVLNFAASVFGGPILELLAQLSKVIGGAMFVTSVIETAGEGGDGTVEIFLRDPVRFHGVATYGNCGPMGVKVTLK
jgi:RHS repeat-associated protein